MKKALIFDFDGTTALTTDALLQSLQSRTSWLRPASKDVNLKELLALTGWKNLLAMIVDESRCSIEKVIDSICGEVCQQSLCYTNNRFLFGGIDELVAMSRTRFQHLGIVTLNTAENVQIMLGDKRTRLFHTIAGSDTHPKQSKASILSQIIEQNGLNPSHSFYVGDEVADMQAAKEVGMQSIAVTWGACHAHVLQASQPTHTASNTTELYEILCRI